MKKVLITGGSGYIASSLYAQLKPFYDITLVNRQVADLRFYKKVESVFKNQKFDVVINSAASGVDNVKNLDWNIFDDNLLIYYNLIQFNDHYKKMINFGSGAESNYKNTPYGYSKSVINQSILNKINFYNIRIFSVFDENELNRRFIKANIINYINKKPIVIYNNKTMDFFYMKDLIALVKYYIDNEDLPKQIDCSYEESKNLLYIANLINSLSNYSVDINIESQDIHPGYFGQYTKLPIKYVGLEKGIQLVYNKIRNEY